MTTIRRCIGCSITIIPILFSQISSFHNPRIAQAFYHNTIKPTKTKNKYLTTTYIKRYGPTDTNSNDLTNNKTPNPSESVEQIEKKAEEEKTLRQKRKIQDLIHQILSAESYLEYPTILTNHLEFLLSLKGSEGVQLFQEIIEESKTSEKEADTASAIDLIVEFISEFVNQTKDMDDGNKQLLGKILKAMTNKGKGVEDGEKESTDRDRENVLDDLLEKEKDNFTPGFMRHLERECARIQGAPALSPESSKLLQTLQLIQIRIIEELGRDLGETALVLNQLLGYDNTEERYAVLEAGLMVRGIAFAEELLEVTSEALQGFEDIPDGEEFVDGELKEIVKGIFGRISAFVDSKR